MERFSPKGRATESRPKNRFEKLHFEPDANLEPELRIATDYLSDGSRSILTENTSPDIPYAVNLNPYRGCEHGCIYCYARPTHEYLGFSAGLDFESKIVVKRDAGELLERALKRSGWRPQVVALSGVTDCYQNIERHLGITRQCLKVLRKFGNPVSVITKSHLVQRDMDILSEMGSANLASVTISITTLSPDLHAVMEPRASGPQRRIETIAALSAAGIPVGVNVSPVIPGLNDHEIDAVLRAAARAGASYAGYSLLRLPGSVEALFLDWLDRRFPNARGKVINSLSRHRLGEITDARFGTRMTGIGPSAELLARRFKMSLKRCRLRERPPELTTELFAGCSAPRQLTIPF